MEVITTNNLTKVYNPDSIPVPAVNGVSLKVKSGEFIAVVGPSGSGKSTLLNLIGGLDRPTSGTVHIGGEDLSQLGDNELIRFRKRNIGFVFQSFNLIPVLSAKENIEFVMMLQRRPNQEVHRRAMELINQVGLDDKVDSRPAQLSGGQQQRVAVARALAAKPKFILADEPTANLDSVSALNLMEIMSKLNREEGITFIFSTHDQRVISRVNRIITLVDGKIASDESTNATNI